MSTIRIDDDLKKKADEMFEDVGMTTSTAVRIFLTKFTKTGKFPFEIEIVDDEYNEETLSAIEETEKIIKQGVPIDDESLNSYFDRMKSEAKEEEDAQ